jgi:hypothetical protein
MQGGKDIRFLVGEKDEIAFGNGIDHTVMDTVDIQNPIKAYAFCQQTGHTEPAA